MSASWAVILLIVASQSDAAVPERLPVPDEFLAPPAAPLPPPQFPSPYLSPSPAVVPQTFLQPAPLELPPPPQVAPFSDPPHFTDWPAAVDEVELPGSRWTLATLGAGSGFGMTSIDFNHTWLLGYGEGPPLSITPGFGMHWWNDPVGLGLPPRVYDAYVDFQCIPWENDRWSVSVGFTPGFYGDFAQVGGKAFQLTGWVVANRRFDPHWQLLFGLAYVRQLQANLVPVGGVIWTPSADLRLEAVIPKPKYAVRFRETSDGSLWWFVAGQLGGGSWAVADGAGDALVAYTDLRLILGIESFRVDGREWSVELGYVFNRNLYIDNSHAASPDGTFSLTASYAY